MNKESLIRKRVRFLNVIQVLKAVINGHIFTEK
jgi:hypothetical protein